MKNNLHITASFDQPELLEDMVEELAYRSSHNQDVNSLKEAIETSTTETYVSGTVELSLDEEHIKMPFITCFIFTCIKENNEAYKMSWALSFN